MIESKFDLTGAICDIPVQTISVVDQKGIIINNITSLSLIGKDLSFQVDFQNESLDQLLDSCDVLQINGYSFKKCKE